MATSPLDTLLERWAAEHRLTEAQVAAIRQSVLGAALPSSREAEPDWLWKLLRPVTDLLEGPRSLHETLSRGYARLA